MHWVKMALSFESEFCFGVVFFKIRLWNWHLVAQTRLFSGVAPLAPALELPVHQS